MGTLWITGAGGVTGSLVAAKAAQQGRFERICAFTHHLSDDTMASPPSINWSVLDISNRECRQQQSATRQPSLSIPPP